MQSTPSVASRSRRARSAIGSANRIGGQGLIPEAGREILHHGFEDLQLTAIWGVHDVNNHKSSRVMDKLGLAPVRTARHVHLKLLGDVYRDELVRRITADEWLTR